MMKLIYAPNPLLSQPSAKIEVFDDSTKQLAHDMFKSMYSIENSAGLAAVQMNVPKKMFVIDVKKQDDEGDGDGYTRYGKFCMINPEITWKSKEKSILEEGCLSCPGIIVPINRPISIEAEYFDENGKKHQIKATDFLSKCIQHETDHLNGILEIDYLSKLKRDMAIKKIQKFLKEKEREKISSLTFKEKV